MKWLGWVMGGVFALALASFAVANRHPARLDLWPLPWIVDLPTYLTVLAPLALGIALGGAATWLGALPARRRAHDTRRRADSLERQLAAQRPSAP